MMPFRVGHGFDVHAFTDGDHLTLGGVRIPYERAFAAHSDGDVLIHAVCDALLGAVGLGDIGRHFPDSDPEFENIDSRRLLRAVLLKVAEAGCLVVNIDSTIIAQTPKMAPWLDKMKRNLARDLKVSETQVNVKATTTETLGFAGRREGIAAHAVALLQARR